MKADNKSFLRRLTAIAPAAGMVLVLSTSFNAAASEEDGRKTRTVALVGDPAPGGGTFRSFDEPMANRYGAVAFQGFLGGDGAGIYLWQDGRLSKIAKTGDTVGGLTLTNTFFDGPAVNDAATVACVAWFDSPNRDAAVLQKRLGSPIAAIVRSGDTIPGGGGIFLAFDDLSQNNSGDVAFLATYALDTGPRIIRAGVFKWSNGTVTTIAKDGDRLPGTNGGTMTANSTLSIGQPWIDGPWINDRGEVAFQPESIPNTTLSDSLFIKPSDEEIRPLVLIGTSFDDGTVESINLGRPALSNEFVGMKVNNSLATRALEEEAAIRSCVKTGDAPPAAPAGYEFEGFQAPALGEYGTLAFSATVALPGSGGTEINPTDNIYTCQARQTRAVSLQGDTRPRPATGTFGSEEEASIGGRRVTFLDEGGSPPGVFVSGSED